MRTPPPPKDPVWINRLLFVAAFLACSAALWAAFAEWGRRPDHHAGLIADITVNLNGRPVREHCTSCHPDGGPARPGTQEDVDQVHPDISPHSAETLGCTGCHLGEGMALDIEVSHGLPGLGARKVLKGRNLQASCYTCHELKPLVGAEKAWQGYELFLGKACDTCHHVAALGQGGRYGPDLSEIGSLLGLTNLQRAIKDPKQAPENSIMPRFPLSRSQVRALGYFLKSRVKDPNHTTPMLVQAGKVPLPPTPSLAAAVPPLTGMALLQGNKCLACHRFRDADGRIAPDLTYIGRMRDPGYLRNFLDNPARQIPGAVMPRIPMPREREERLIRSLAREAAVLPTKTDTKHLYMELCQRCHAASGDGYGPIQPNLANFPRAFANNAEFFRRIPDTRISQSIEKGIPGTSMPPYGNLLGREVLAPLIDLIFGTFIGITRDDKIPLPPLPSRPTHPLTEEKAGLLFRDRCLRCHGIAGTGTGPEHLKHLPRPRNLTNPPYFASLKDERIVRAIADGIPGTAMPSFRDQLSAEELWGLVGKVRRLSGGRDER